MNSRGLIYVQCYNNSEASAFKNTFYKESI